MKIFNLLFKREEDKELQKFSRRMEEFKKELEIYKKENDYINLIIENLLSKREHLS